ncbi:MAG: hypothetical protein BroJett011_13880 [Chloroflexota bacterium]|nr:MAG: hypothetical protein BroJett011_13880 [Chloroflexota bacterium]
MNDLNLIAEASLWGIIPEKRKESIIYGEITFFNDRAVDGTAAGGM